MLIYKSMKEFFIIVNNRFNDTQYAFGEEKEIDFNVGGSEYCDGCGRPISALKWLPPYNVKASKKCLGEFIFGTFVGFLISENIKDRFEQSNLKGLQDFKKVNLYYKNKYLPINYYYPYIFQIKAFVDYSKVVFDKMELCNICQKGGSIIKKIDGITFIDPDKIEEDIFFTTAIGQGLICISESFKYFVESNGFTNLEYIKASEYKYDSMIPR